ncbi:CsgG/HfaB family protein [Allohahella marinimesophila]
MSRRLVLPAAVVATLTLGACSYVAKPTSALLPGNAEGNRIGATLAQTDKMLKRKVAIAGFTDDTRHGNAFGLNQGNDRVGEQAMDILSRRLSETGQFLMLERADLDKLHTEQSLKGLQHAEIGADYLIVGSISEFGRSAESEVGMFSRNKIQAARAKLNVRLVDVKTGQIIYSQESSGEATAEADTVVEPGQQAAYDASLDARAISAAISQLMSSLVNNLLDQPWRAYVIGEQDGQYILTGGQSQGIVVGDEFRLMKPGQLVRNPQTGMLLELPGKQVGMVRVESFGGYGHEEIALASLVSGRIDANNLAAFYVVNHKPALQGPQS